MKKIYFNIIFTLLLVCSIFVGRNVSAYDFSNFDAYNDKLTYEMIEELTIRAFNEEFANDLLSNKYIHCFVQEHYNHVIDNTVIECKFIDTNGISVYLYQNSAGNYINSSSFYGARWTYQIDSNSFTNISNGHTFNSNSAYFYNETPTNFWWVKNGVTSVITQVLASEDFYIVFNGENKYFNSIISEQVPINNKFNGSNDESINSLDFYLEIDKITKSYDFEINYIDNYDYTNSNLAYADIKSYSLTGLINDNGLYHWVEIPNSIGELFNWYVSQYDEDCWETEDCHLYESNNIDGTGFYYKQKLNFNFDISLYEQLKFRINLTNANDYTIEYGDNYDSISVDYMDLNYSALGDYEEFYNYSRIPSNGYRYITFTTYKELMSDSIMIKTDQYLNESSPLVFIDTFNTYTYSFIDYDGFNFNVYGDKYKYFRYLFNIGTSVTKGFYLTQNYNEDEEYFDYFVYVPNDLYYSYSDYADESIFINNSGDVISGGIIPSYDVIDRPDDYTTGQFDVSIDYFSSPIRYVFVCMSRFYDGLPIEIKYTLIAVLTISASLIVIKFIL